MSTKSLLIAALGGLALSLPGCLSLGGDAPPPIRRHSIDLPAISVETPAPVFSPIIVRGLTARGRYEPRVLVEDGPGRVEYLELDRWVEEPGRAVTTVLRETLATSGRFEAVAASTSEMQTDLVLDGSLLAFDVVRRPGQPWRARLALRLEVTKRSTGEMVATGAYEAERELSGASTDGLGAAMGECLRDITERAMDEWQAIEEADRAADRAAAEASRSD